VIGIRGLFFRAQDPAALARWYQEHLGVALTPTSFQELPWRQEGGPTVFSPLPTATDYFADTKQVWMVDFRVAISNAMTAVTSDRYPERFGRAALPERPLSRLHDPEGNPIELWQLAGPDVPS
jgi:glyoxylase I family protein